MEDESDANPLFISSPWIEDMDEDVGGKDDSFEENKLLLIFEDLGDSIWLL